MWLSIRYFKMSSGDLENSACVISVHADGNIINNSDNSNKNNNNDHTNTIIVSSITEKKSRSTERILCILIVLFFIFIFVSRTQTKINIPKKNLILSEQEEYNNFLRVFDKDTKCPIYILKEFCIYHNNSCIQEYLEKKHQISLKIKEYLSRKECIESVIRGDVLAIKLLILQRNTTITTPNSRGCMPLHFACIEGFTHIVELLLDAGCDLNKQNDLGKTALHYSASNGYKKIVDLLIKSGKCHLNLLDKKGKSALFYSQINRKIDITDLLLSHGAQ